MLSRQYGLALLMGLFTLSCSRLPDRQILAQVENDPLFVSDLKKALQEDEDQYEPDLLKDVQGGLAVKKKILNGLIEEKILLQVARERKVALTAQEEETLAQQLKSGYGEGGLDAVLQRKKIAWKGWFERQKRKSLIEKLISQEIDPKVTVSSEEIAHYYETYSNYFQEPDAIRCRHIVAGKRDKAEMILSLLNNGENFAAVAKKYSESPDRDNGGDLGYIMQGQYPPVFDTACFSLATGQTSQVIASEYGYHIFRAMDKKPGSLPSLQEATPRITGYIREYKRRLELGKWLEELHRVKKIEIDEEVLEKINLGETP